MNKSFKKKSLLGSAVYLDSPVGGIVHKGFAIYIPDLGEGREHVWDKNTSICAYLQANECHYSAQIQ